MNERSNRTSSSPPPHRIRPECRRQLLAIDIDAAQRHQKLQQIEWPLLCFAAEFDRLAIANELESAEQSDAQAERPIGACVGRRDQRVALDQAHELGLDAVLERVIGEPGPGPDDCA